MKTRAASNQWIVLIATGCSVFAVFLDTTILYVAFPSISRTFSGTSTAALSWVLNAYTIVFAAALIPAGRLADRIGRRRLFLSAVVIFTLASMLCGIAPSVEFLIGARIIQALGAAAMIPASLALVLQTFSKEKMPIAVAIWGALGAISGAAGPSLGGLVVEHLGWRWAFFINLPVGIFSLVLGLRVLPEGREVVRGRLPDPLGAVLAPQTGRLAAKYGQRPLLLIGGLVWGSGGLWLFINATATPHYASAYLVAIVLTGCGVALCLPQLSSAAVKDLPPDQLGAGSAVGQAIRNLGTTLGVATALALTAHNVSIASFDHIWIVLMTSGVLVSLLATRLPRQAKPLVLPPEPATSTSGPSGDR